MAVSPKDHHFMPWGNTLVRFKLSHFSPKEVKKALDEVTPTFEAPKDFFVAIGRGKGEVIGGVPETPFKTNQPTFFSARGVNGLKTLLMRINENLKKRFDLSGYKSAR